MSTQQPTFESVRFSKDLRVKINSFAHSLGLTITLLDARMRDMKIGDKIKIDTASGSYQERAKE